MGHYFLKYLIIKTFAIALLEFLSDIALKRKPASIRPTSTTLLPVEITILDAKLREKKTAVLCVFKSGSKNC